MLTVLENTGCEDELISLRQKNISGCMACLGCVPDSVCKVNDDMALLREKIATTGKTLAPRLRKGHDRKQIAQNMQKK